MIEPPREPLDPLAAAAFEALVQRAGDDVIVLVDARLRIARAGPGSAELAERPSDDLIGMSLIAAFGSAALDTIARSARRGRPARGEATLGPLGSRSFRVEAVPIVAGGLVLSLHDITALRRIERVRRDFVANISHELRTPLSSIKLLAETLSSGAADDPDTAREFATQIEREADHLAQLVDELFDLSMIESGETRLAIAPLDPEEVVAGVAERIRPVAQRRSIRVSVVPSEADHASVRVAADAERLGQALLNLAHNAVKYSHVGGEIRLGWQARARRVRFTIADDGVGIPEAHRERIFERFYKVDRSRTRGAEVDDEQVGRTSSGLGLAIVRHITEAHRGRAGVESREGAGSTFWIEIPRTS
jgi:two-component system, OmpR family, phosphate regulon sensor histidine kinase PhoR